MIDTKERPLPSAADVIFFSRSIVAPPAFRFLDPGPLVHRELELVPPQPRWIDDLLVSARHPLTLRDAPEDARITRQALEQYLAAAPYGRHPGDPTLGQVPWYRFWLLLRHGPANAHQRPLLRIAGDVSLRISNVESVERYYGHIGYHVYPAVRGQSYSARAVSLLLPLARAHGLRHLWITCNPDNHASRRTCEKLGARLIDTVTIPPHEPLYLKGERQKMRYRLDLYGPLN